MLSGLPAGATDLFVPCVFQIASEAGEAQRQANESLITVLQLTERQRELTREFSRNELDVRKAVSEVSQWLRRPGGGGEGRRQPVWVSAAGDGIWCHEAVGQTSSQLPQLTARD